MVAPTFRGIAQLGQTFTASPGTWTPSGSTVTFRWVVVADTVKGDDPTAPLRAHRCRPRQVHPRPGDRQPPGMASLLSVGRPQCGRGRRAVTAPATDHRDHLRRATWVEGTLRVGRWRGCPGLSGSERGDLQVPGYLGGEAIADATHRRQTVRTPYVEAADRQAQAQGRGSRTRHRVDEADGTDPTLNRATSHVRRRPGGHLWATVPRGLLTPPLPFGLFIFIELSEWIFLNG